MGGGLVPCGSSSPKCALGEVKMRVNKPCWADRCGRATPIKSCASLARATSKKHALHRVSRDRQVCPRKGAHWFDLDFIDSLHSMHSSYSRCQLSSSAGFFFDSCEENNKLFDQIMLIITTVKLPIFASRTGLLGLILFSKKVVVYKSFHLLFALLSFLS